jgi:hypothetical protein
MWVLLHFDVPALARCRSAGQDSTEGRKRSAKKKRKEIGWPPLLFFLLVGFCCLFFLTHNVPQDTPTKRQQCRSHKNKKHKIANGWVVLRLLKGS